VKLNAIDFNQKFTVVGQGTLGEYSFASHTFPVSGGADAGFCIDASRTFFGNCLGGVLHVNVFNVQHSVNRADFDWSLPMSEAEANNFVKSRTMTGDGRVNRAITIKVIYSIINKKGMTEADIGGMPANLVPYIHSIEVYSDAGLSKRLGILIKQPGIPESAYGTEIMQAAQSASKTIGTYRYIVSYGDQYLYLGDTPKTPIYGTIALTDVGATLLNDEHSGMIRQNISFFDSFSAGNGQFRHDINVTRVLRSDYPYYHDLRIIWDALSNDPNKSPLVFDSRQERDRFFSDLTMAMQQWRAKYPQFADTRIDVDQRCQDTGGYLVTCPEATPTAVSTAAHSNPSTFSATPDRSLPALLRDIDSGREVSIPIKFNPLPSIPQYAGFYCYNGPVPTCGDVNDPALTLSDGVLTLSKTAFAFIGSCRINHGFGRIENCDFQITPDKILALENQPQFASRLYVQVAVKNKKGYKEDKKNYYFYNAGAAATGAGVPGGTGTSISCSGCDDSMSILYELLTKAHGSK
jgi:hypothetical protein